MKCVVGWFALATAMVYMLCGLGCDSKSAKLLRPEPFTIVSRTNSTASGQKLILTTKSGLTVFIFLEPSGAIRSAYISDSRDSTFLAITNRNNVFIDNTMATIKEVNEARDKWQSVFRDLSSTVEGVSPHH